MPGRIDNDIKNRYNASLKKFKTDQEYLESIERKRDRSKSSVRKDGESISVQQRVEKHISTRTRESKRKREQANTRSTLKDIEDTISVSSENIKHS